jgi:hypothetical protein
MRCTMRAMIGATGAAVLGLAAWAPAQADPANAKGALPITVTCDNGHTYSVVANGNGAWTPAHDLDSTAVLIPVAFGPITSTVYDTNGNIVDQETEPADAKPGASVHNRNATTHCSFSASVSFPDGTFTLEGTVVGFVTPAR